MNHRYIVQACLAAALASPALSAHAVSVAVMDQIGPSASAQEGRFDNRTQIANLYPSAPQYNIAVMDDFVLERGTVLEAMDIALFATRGYDVFAGLQLKIFDHQPTRNEAMNAAGVRNWFVARQEMSTQSWTSHPFGMLAHLALPTSDELPAGSYWLWVAALNNSFSSDAGVFMSSYAGLPGNGNARQIGSLLWGGPGGDRALLADAAIRLVGQQAIPVPEPATYALMALGLVAVGGAARTRLSAASRAASPAAPAPPR